MSKLQTSNHRLLHLNVGFLLKEGVGTSRAISFDVQQLTINDISLDTLVGLLNLSRTAHGILVSGRLEAETQTECVRCLTAVTTPFTLTLSEHFLYPPSTAQGDDYIVGEDGIINLEPILREDAILAIPMHTLCRDDCKGLCSQCGQNLNVITCECEHNTIDPRLEGLKALLDS